MLRKFLGWLLRADLEPFLKWREAEIAPGRVARISADCPSVFGGTEKFEQVLCDADDRYTLYSRWKRTGSCTVISVRHPLNAPEMRIFEQNPGPPSVYRLQLAPEDKEAIVYKFSHRTWFGLWRSEAHTGIGSGACFLDSNDREQLVQLRARLLDGNVPESLLAEEEMWQRMNSLSPEQRRAAMVSMMNQSLAAIDRQFDEHFPDHGPVPDNLRPAMDAIQQRIGQIQQSAAGQEVDPELRKLMQQFVANATQRPKPWEDDPARK